MNVKERVLLDGWVFFCLLCVSCFVHTGVCSAEFYKYVDERGVSCVTDDLAEVPEAQREKMETYEASDPGSAPEESSEGVPEGVATVRENEGDRAGTEAGEETGPDRLKELLTRKATLDDEYAQVRAEQEALVLEGRRVETKGQARVHRERMRAFNERRAVYQKMRDDLERDWDAYYDSSETSPELERLKATKAALNAERAQLEVEQAALLEEGLKAKRSSRLVWLDSRMRELNARIAAHQKKRDVFDREWNAYHSPY